MSFNIYQVFQESQDMQIAPEFCPKLLSPYYGLCVYVFRKMKGAGSFHMLRMAEHNGILCLHNASGCLLNAYHQQNF